MSFIQRHYYFLKPKRDTKSNLRASLQVLLLATSLLFIISCGASRKPLLPGQIPQATTTTTEDERAGHELLNQLSQKYELDYDHPRRAEVDEIARKITDSIGASSIPWHLHVFKDPTVKNAAATKGNHIFVWSGIIDATQNKDELAGVLAHEIAHVLAKHTEPTEEEAVRKLLVEIGAFAAGTAASIAVGGAGARVVGQLTSQATTQVGSGLLIYPYSRDKELEADQIGLFLAAKAGYNPEGFVNFWTRATSDPDFSASIPFFSTHPPAADRMDKLIQLLPLVKNQMANNTLNQGTNGKTQGGIIQAQQKAPNHPPASPVTQIPNSFPTTFPSSFPSSLPNSLPTPSAFPMNKNDSFAVPVASPVKVITLPKDPSTPQVNLPIVNSPNTPETKTPGIKSTDPLKPDDSFNVGPDVLKERFGNKK